MKETPLAMKERHAREFWARVTRQEEIVSKLVKGNHADVAKTARALLAAYKDSLQIAQEGLEQELRWRDQGT